MSVYGKLTLWKSGVDTSQKVISGHYVLLVNYLPQKQPCFTATVHVNRPQYLFNEPSFVDTQTVGRKFSQF